MSALLPKADDSGVEPHHVVQREFGRKELGLSVHCCRAALGYAVSPIRQNRAHDYIDRLGSP